MDSQNIFYENILNTQKLKSIENQLLKSWLSSLENNNIEIYSTYNEEKSVENILEL